MRKKLAVGILLAAGTMFAETRIGVVIGGGAPPAEVYEPAPPPCPGPGYTWTAGYWDWSGPNRYWHPGYWVAPRYFRDDHHDRWDRRDRDDWRRDYRDHDHDRHSDFRGDSHRDWRR